MAILVTCKCGQQFQTRDENAGRRARCPDCGHELVVPDADQAGGEEFFVPGSAGTATSGKAIASLVLGLCFFCVIVTGLPAIILGCLALGDINRSGGRLKGTWMGITGIVLGVLSSTVGMAFLLLPAVSSSREAARRSQCVNNLKQIGLAMHNYHDVEGSFPPASINDAEGRPLLSWRVAILPYLEQSSLYQQFHLDEPWDSPHNITLLDKMPPVYACPSDPNHAPSLSSYQVLIGPRTMFTGDKPVRLADVTDGTSNTILVGESRAAVNWTDPNEVLAGKGGPQAGLASFHPGGFNTLFADGSVRFLKTSIAPVVLHSLMTRDGGEVISSASY